MTYYDKNNKKIRQGDILYFEFGNGSMNVMPVSKQNGELGIISGKEFVPLSNTHLEYARLKRPCKNRVKENMQMDKNAHKELMTMMFSKNKEEVNEMFNSGVFNEIVKGYVARLLSEHVIFGDEAIKKAMSDMNRIFDEMTAGEAREFYKNF